MISSIKNFILDLLFPAFCSSCKKEGKFICDQCLQELKKTALYPKCFYCGIKMPSKNRVIAGRTCKPCRKKTYIYAFFSPFPYSNIIIKDLTHKLKYERVTVIAEILGKELADSFLIFYKNIPANSLIIPIPLHHSRYRERGFNQSELLAKVLSEKTDIEISLKALIKIKSTLPQIELKREQRKKNLIGAFNAPHPEIIKDRNVILIDDIKTTGSTLEEAAKIAKKAGAKRIWALTVAS